MTAERRFQARGLARRQKLIDAARQLLRDRDYAEVSFALIASEAGVPEGSAYHFFPNRQAIFQAIARESNDEFREAIQACKPVAGAGWNQLLAEQVSACLDVYRRDPTYQKLLPTMSIDPESYTVEHEGNRELAVAWAEELRRHYSIPDSTPLAEKLRLMIECVDALISLALVERGAVDDDCLTECQRLATAYIGLYIPACTEPAR